MCASSTTAPASRRRTAPSAARHRGAASQRGRRARSSAAADARRVAERAARAARGQKVARRAAQPAEGLARGGGLGRGMVDPPAGERRDDGARTEEVLDGEAQRRAGTGLAGGDDGDAGAGAAALLLGEHGGGDGARVADARRPARAHRWLPRHRRDRRSRRGSASARQRVTGLDGLDRRRRQSQHVDEHDDVGRREPREAVDAPLEADLVAWTGRRDAADPDSLGARLSSPAPAAAGVARARCDTEACVFC